MIRRMFRVYTVAPVFAGRKDVVLIFCYAGRRENTPYAWIIDDYYKIPRDERIYCESAIDELFYQSEVRALRAYLEGKYRYKVKACVEPGLIDKDAIGISALPLGGGRGQLDLTKLPDYPLPFPVVACYNLPGVNSGGLDDAAVGEFVKSILEEDGR